jgi:hypothetical protein
MSKVIPLPPRVDPEKAREERSEAFRKWVAGEYRPLRAELLKMLATQLVEEDATLWVQAGKRRV